MLLKTKFEAFSMPDGSIVETYISEGKLHREDGPAWRLKSANGTTVEMYFRNGALDRRDGPAIDVSHYTGAGVSSYFHDGVNIGKPPSYPLR